ncbi:Mitochondrial matrix cochaperone, partial [Ascosphaera acerosa]
MIPRSVLRQAQAAVARRSTTAAAIPRTTPAFASITPLPLPRQSQLQASRASYLAAPRVVGGSRRWVSSEAKKAEAEKTADASKPAEKDAEAGKAGSAEEQLRKEIEEKNKEIISLKVGIRLLGNTSTVLSERKPPADNDKYLRSVADFRNLQARAERDIAASKQFGIQKFAADLLDSIDNLDRALGAVPAEKLAPAADGANKELIELHSGLRMTERVLFATLKKHGVERYDPLEPAADGKPQKFDPALHEATFQAPAPGKQDGEIMYTQTKGFLLNGRVLRAAKVGVVKNG